MKVLAIDTALDEASAALWEGDGTPDAGAISEAACAERGAASRDLLPAIDRLLKTRGWTVKDLDGVVLTIGPGSFTGLRIGVSLVKGLAAGRPLRTAAVGTLDAVAVASGCSGRVAALLDARSGEVYARLFLCEQSGAEPLSDEALADPVAWAKALAVEGPVWCVGAGAVRYRAELLTALGPAASIAPAPVMTAAAAALRLAAPGLAAGLNTAVEELLPRYIRRSVAETNLERGLVGSRRRSILGWDPAHGRT